MALTAKQIEAAGKDGRHRRLSDGHGLHLEVDDQGRKYWNWRFRWPLRGPDQKQCELRLGPCGANGGPGLSLKEAREARSKWEAVRRSGKDPRLAKKEEGLELRGASASRFENVAKDWVERRQDWSEQHRNDVLSKLRLHVLPVLGALDVQQIRAQHARIVLAPLDKAGKAETARKCLSITSQVIDHAVVNGWAELNVFAATKKALAIRTVKHHYPCLKWKEIPDFWKAVENYSLKMDHSTHNALRLQALTFVRPGELIGMRWDEIDWDRKQWHIPASRMKGRRGHNRDHIVPLSSQALAVLNNQKEISGHHVHVFHSSRASSGHLSNMTINMVLSRIDYSGKMCAHGFRALAMTALQEEKKVDRIYIDRQLAHVPESKVAAAYNRAEYIDERTSLMKVWGDMLEEAGMSLPT